LTPDIVDRVFPAYATDLGRIDEFIDEIDRWKIRWQQNIDKPERLRQGDLHDFFDGQRLLVYMAQYRTPTQYRKLWYTMHPTLGHHFVHQKVG
jgi:hypothetical protein